QGVTGWRPLPTTVAGDRLVATVPDMELEDGIYELRALARDRAGNERVADRYADGSRAVIVLPVRDATRLVGEARGAPRRVCRVVRRGRTRRRVCRTTADRARLGATLVVPFGRTASVRGALQTFAGRPVVGSTLVVTTESRTGRGSRLVATLRTGREGAFAYTAPAGPSRTLR